MAAADTAPEDNIQKALDDPTASSCVKTALRGALRREPVAAADDPALLATLLRDRVGKTLSLCA
jgi:hypothetical protein